MSKKKQVTFQSQIPGKFIPRENPPVTAAVCSATNDHRFNSRMAELLASSSTNSNENPIEQISPPVVEHSINDTSRAQSKVLRRRIVTMLDSLRRHGTNNSNPISTQIEPKSQPITFGQLRKATISPNAIVEEEKKEHEEIQREESNVKSPLTVDDILARYYTKIQVTNPTPPVALPTFPSSGWTPPPVPLLFNEQNRNRPPPPSYSSSIANTPRAVPFIRPPVVEPFFSTNRIAPPPPRYETPPSVIPKGFDREFSRLLYGKEAGRNRRHRPKRKAFSDPVKKSVEEAGRSVEKARRRLTTHLNRTDTVREEEETSSESNEIESRRSSSRSSRMTIVPANPMLKTPIPSFLRVYAEECSENDFRLQWKLFAPSELESYEAMMTKLYKDENLKLVQLYENYRAVLTTLLNNKIHRTVLVDEDEEDSITTTAL